MPRLPSLQARISSEESGFTLIEVLVSAILVVVLSVGVLKALDAAEASSGNTKARAIASNLAQQDQERLRAYRAKELSNARETRVRTIGGVPYTVESRSDWVSDASGSRSCNGASARADYMKINSTVTWPEMLGAKPVSTTSVVSAPNGSFGDEGSLGVEVLNRSGGGQAGVTVTVSGPKNLSDSTDSNGCVFFGFLPEGNYTVSFSKPGHVDANGVNAVSRLVGVQNETTQVQTIDYDLAASRTVNVETKRGAQDSSPRTATTGFISLGHANLASPGYRVFGTGTAASSFAPASLFPFTSAYSFYTGNCAANNPEALNPVGTVFPSLALRTLAAGSTGTITIREPAVRMMQNGGSTIWPNNSTAKLTSVTCGGTTTLTTDSSGWAQVGGEYGIPYGVYNICVSGGSPVRRRTRSGENINSGDGESVDMGSQSGGTTGACP